MVRQIGEQLGMTGCYGPTGTGVNSCPQAGHLTFAGVLAAEVAAQPASPAISNAATIRLKMAFMAFLL
jgi:hypothetical protein